MRGAGGEDRSRAENKLNTSTKKSCGLKRGWRAQLVVDDDLSKELDAALQVLQPLGGPCQWVGRKGVVHHHAVDVLDGLFVGDVRHEERGVLRRGAVVAADVEIPAVGGGDQADVLALGLGTLAHAARDAHLPLVRSAEALVALLDAVGHADRVLHTEATPAGPDAALHCSQSLAVGVSGFHAIRVHLGQDLAICGRVSTLSIAQLLPDVWQLPNVSTEEANALGSCKPYIV